jgi:hypothetical protein
VTGPRLFALALGLCLVAGPALAKGLDPDHAASTRAELLDAQPEDPRAAIDHLTRAGEELGDPELFMLAAKAALAEAERARDDALAHECVGLALIARDIALHLGDERNFDATDWRPVTRERAVDLAEQAAALAAEAEQLAETIVAERAAAEAEARRAAEEAARAEAEQRRSLRPGTGLIIGGSVALTIGAGGLGMIGAGIAIGQARQRDAEALAPGQLAQLDELDRQGAQANAIAFAGIGVATVGIAVGTALVVVGLKKREAAGASQESAARGHMLVGGWLGRESAGLNLSGSF